MNKPDFSKFYRYDEMVKLLRSFEGEFPELAELEVIGRSYEDREIWALTVTSKSTGRSLDKPGFYVDAAIHGSEVTGTTVALYFAWLLLSQHGVDSVLTDLVGSVSFYIIPMVSPDGVEQELSTPDWVRSGTRMYPYEEPRDGLYREDIDGDGQIVSMRIEDPSGGWKTSERDARLLVPRRFHDTRGPFYRVYPEGTVRNFDGVEVTEAPARYGLDFNRNYPANWQSEVTQPGAGEYPLSESETRAVAEFFTRHANICGVHALHTGMESIIRPPETLTDSEMNAADLRRVCEIGQFGAEATGYVLFSCRQFNDEMSVAHGDLHTWAYEQLGLIVFVDELWDVRSRGNVSCIELARMHREGDLDGLELAEVTALRWNDDELSGAGFVNRRSFEHPQLGPVEIGGWKKEVLHNAPLHSLAGIAQNLTRFLIAYAQASPQLHAEICEAERIAENTYRLAVAVRNTGYLPTNVTERALEMDQAPSVQARIKVGIGDEVLTGNATEMLGHLGGYGGRRKVEWIIRFGAEPKATVTIAGTRAGVVRLEWAKNG